MSTPDFQLPRHRLTVDEHYRMAEIGILAPDARVELIEGEIIDMTSQGSRHAAIVSRLYERLAPVVGASALVRCQLPIRLGIRSEPEPDFAIVKRHAHSYMDAHPVAEDVLLLIEISATTVSYDRLIKVPLYARHGVVETWLVEVPLGRVQRFRSPQHGSYADVSVIERPGILCPVLLSSVPVDFAGLLEAP
jgi:Uma2 family endonuclease